MSEKEQKEVVKQAIKEWLDEKFLQFGKWTIRTVGAVLLGGLVWFIVDKIR